MRAQLQQKEETLLAEIQRLEQEQNAWETQIGDLRSVTYELHGILCIIRSGRPAAPVAQSVSARYLYDSTEICRGCEFEPRLEHAFYTAAKTPANACAGFLASRWMFANFPYLVDKLCKIDDL